MQYKSWKNRVKPIVIYFWGLIILAACEPAPPIIDRGKILPELSLQTLERKVTKLNTSEYDLLVVNVWAVWCPPCRAEMPALQTLSNRVRENNPDGSNIGVVALAVEDDANLVKEFLNKYKLRFPIYVINKSDAETQLGLVSYPLTFLVDKGGRILARLNGAFEWDNDKVYGLLKKLAVNPEADIREIENFRLNDPVK